MLEKDPFVEIAAAAKEEASANNVNVRRPIMGLLTKENSWAYMAVYRASSGQKSTSSTQSISLIDSSAPGGFSLANHNFILQGVTVSRKEKVQVVETFGDHFSFFFGERPIVYSCDGILLNTVDFNWKNEWIRNYNLYLRGTKCVENQTRVYMGFDDILVEGFLLDTTIVYNKDLPNLCPFKFNMLVTNELDLSGINSPVKQAEEARTGAIEGGSSEVLLEYLTDIGSSDTYSIDPTTGEIRTDPASSSGNLPASTNEAGLNDRSAFWIGDPNSSKKQYNEQSDALRAVEIEITMQQAGVDRTTAILQQAGILQQANVVDSLPLSTRSDAVANIGSSLTTGVANTAAVIDEVPSFG